VTELLHITDRATWENARRSGAYEMSTRGRTLGDEGFIHCAEEFPHVYGPVPLDAIRRVEQWRG
jgi:uncharacterized protein (DUF952 family)